MKRTIAFLLIIPLLLLAAAFGLKGVTERVSQKEHIKLMETLLEGGENFIRLDYSDEIIRSVHKSEAGYIIEAQTAGYADKIIMQIGVNNEGRVMGVTVKEAHETYGLGNGILNDREFLSQFLNKSGSFSVASKQDAFSGATDSNKAPGEEIYVDAISGATVSSKAVIKCVNAAVGYVTGADIESSATEWGGE